MAFWIYSWMSSDTLEMTICVANQFKNNIVCHFSEGHAMVTKILDFIHKHPNYIEGGKVIFLLS